jgi:hypothetical protein
VRRSKNARRPADSSSLDNAAPSPREADPEEIRRGWPLAICTAYNLGDIAAVRELLAMIDDCPPGHLAPMQLAERTLVRARLADRDGYARRTADGAPMVTAPGPEESATARDE